MPIELTKREKKVARAIIEKGLQKEFETGIVQLDAIIQNWKERQSGNRETYHLLYKTLTDFDKHIARRYDGMRGSRYLLIMVGQILDEVITEEDLNDLEPQTRNAVLGVTSKRNL